MITRIGRRKYNVMAFDLESHNDTESIEKKETSMWLGCLIDETSKQEDENIYFYTMDEFIDHLEIITKKAKRAKANETRKNVNYAIYIYNLSFEWSFILPVLIKRGFKYSYDFSKEEEYIYNSISTKSCSSVWQVKIKFAKGSGEILFRDMAKMYGGGLAAVAKSFNLETQKGEIDYRLNRLHGHIVTQEEKQYIFRDVKIIMEILEKVKEDKTFWKSVSMSSYAISEMIKFAYRKKYRPYGEFRKEYPELGEEETKFLRAGVEGGITYATPRWQFIDINHPILHIDAHQMHPTQMFKHRFPYGPGEYGLGMPKEFARKINCCHIKVSYSGVKLHSIIKLIGIDFVEGYELTVWDFELGTMLKCYDDLKIEFIDYYAYAIKPLPWKKKVYSNFQARKKAKELGDDYNTLRFKLMNNGSYGKLLEKPHNDIYINTIREDGCIDSLVEHKDELHQQINAKYTYIPVGSCIPAYSRVMLIETALKFGWQNVVYFDTDSIFMLYNEHTKKVWETQINQNYELGGWGLEDISSRAQFTAPKRYKLEVDGKVVVKAAGINFNPDKDVLFEELNITDSTWNIQRAFRCKGGTIIDFQEKTMSVQKKYQSIYLQNTQQSV